MDVYLSKETYRDFEALSMLSNHASGLLLGHKRGSRYMVERIFILPEGLPLSEERYFNLEDHFDSRIMGIFSFNPGKIDIQKILHPYTYGQLFLKITQNSRKDLNIEPFIIEYKKEFLLCPVKICSTA